MEVLRYIEIYREIDKEGDRWSDRQREARERKRESETEYMERGIKMNQIPKLNVKWHFLHYKY